MEVDSPLPDQEQLVRGLAHRMNNILTVFHGYVGIMLDNDSLDSSTREGLCRIKAGARAATELMDRAHSLVRRPAIVRRQVDLDQMIGNLLPAIESLRKPNTHFVRAEPGPLPLVSTDASRLRTALLEIVRNAFEAATILPAGGQVSLSLAEVAPPSGLDSSDPRAAGPWVVLAVSDNGPGIPPEIAAKIFQPFFSTKRKQEATGLGLNVAQGLLRECGGFLRHVIQPSQTKFEILLPTN